MVHSIDETSPLYGWTEDMVQAAHTEVLVLLSGFDESYAQTGHARSSYADGEILWGMRFVDIFDHDASDGVLAVDIGRLSAEEAA